MLIHLYLAWIWFLLGVLGGIILGLFFHKENWLGGYNSWTRRLLRLGHISFFGLGLLNICFYFTAINLELNNALKISSYGFLLGAISMPLICSASAFIKPLRNLFFIPVLSTLTGIVSLLFALFKS